MDKFDTTVNQLLAEDFKSAAAAGLLGLGALTTPSARAAEPTPIVKSDNTFLTKAFDYIRQNEGLKLMPYDDTKGIPTIGIGHRILPNEDFSKGITKQQAQSLFNRDIQSKLAVAKRLFPRFDTYPDYLKVALLDGVFRGDHKSKYRTTKLINNGDFVNASKEYLNHSDYRKSKVKDTGVWKRMKTNSDAMLKYGVETQS